jgi:hypothetical protein
LSETNLATLRIPANSMGKNGVIQVTLLVTYTNSANTKLVLIRFNATSGVTASGQVGGSLSTTTTAQGQGMVFIRNTNNTAAQSHMNSAPNSPFGIIGGAPTTGSVDTTADAFININGTLANTGETITLINAIALVMPSA